MFTSVNEYSCDIDFCLFNPLIVGNLVFLVIFTYNPVRCEFGCPLYRIPLIHESVQTFIIYLYKTHATKRSAKLE